MIKRVAFTILPMTDVGRARRFYEETLQLAIGSHGNRGEQWSHLLPHGREKVARRAG